MGVSHSQREIRFDSKSGTKRRPRSETDLRRTTTTHTFSINSPTVKKVQANNTKTEISQYYAKKINFSPNDLTDKNYQQRENNKQIKTNIPVITTKSQSFIADLKQQSEVGEKDKFQKKVANYHHEYQGKINQNQQTEKQGQKDLPQLYHTSQNYQASGETEKKCEKYHSQYYDGRQKRQPKIVKVQYNVNKNDQIHSPTIKYKRVQSPNTFHQKFYQQKILPAQSNKSSQISLSKIIVNQSQNSRYLDNSPVTIKKTRVNSQTNFQYQNTSSTVRKANYPYYRQEELRDVKPRSRMPFNNPYSNQYGVY